MRTALALASLFLLSSAAATGTLDAGPLVIAYDNGATTDCAEELTGLCIATIRGEDVASMEIGTRQPIEFLGLAVNDTWIEERTGVELLPGGEMIVVRPSSLRVPISIYRPIIDHVGTVWLPANGSGVTFTEEGRGYRLFVPDPRGPDAFLIAIDYFMTWDETEESDPFERDQIRPAQHVIAAETDAQYEWPGLACYYAQNMSGACRAAVRAVDAAAENSTPNVVFGLSFVEAAAGNDPTFGLAGPVGPRETAEPPLSRVPAPMPPALLARDAGPHPTPGPDPRAHGVPGGPAPPPAPARDPSRAALAGPAGNPPVEPDVGIPVLLVAASFLLAVILATLYSRLTDEDERSRPTRARILQLLATEGAMSFTQIGERLGLDRTTVTYHVRRLQRVGAASATRVGGSMIVHLPERPAEATRGGPAARAIVAALRAHGGAIPRHALHETCASIPHRTRNRALRDLVSTGSIERVFLGNVEHLRLRG